MKNLKQLCMIAVFGLASSVFASAQENGYWRPVSSTAMSITGPLTFSTSRITLNFSTFPLAQIREMKPAEISAVFDGENSTTGSGNLYRVSIPATKTFLHRNTLCGAEDTQWVVTFASGKDLRVAMFTGAKMPIFTPEAVANTTSLCGTYTYVR